MRTSPWILVLALAAPAAGASFPTPDMAAAEKEMQLFYHSLKPGADPAVKRPAWLEEELPKMAERKVWRDPEAGDLSEAQLWQAPASVLYEFFKAVRMDSPESSLYDRETDYNNLLLNYRIAIDRIRRSKLQDSLGGRGAALLAAFSRAFEPLDGLLDSLPSGDTEAFQRAAAEVARDARAAFAQLSAPPQAPEKVTYWAKDRLVPGYRGFSLPLPGHQLAFIKKGQRVDVLVTFEALMKRNVKEKVTATILQNVVVIDVLRPDQPEGRGALLLLVNPNEAQYAALSVLQGDVRITARAEGDTAMAPMEMASLRKLFK
ncbi:MAG: hypothetical protein HY926_12720 [Elusimicrobia bacterium]|nr:hypothetical protein [Elusimicrobiota bacterium]